VVWFDRWADSEMQSAERLAMAKTAGATITKVDARLGHAEPVVTLRVYSHALREHAVSVRDASEQAVKAPVSESVSKPTRQRKPYEYLAWWERWSGAGSNRRPSAFQRSFIKRMRPHRERWFREVQGGILHGFSSKTQGIFLRYRKAGSVVPDKR
jgi:hypothetical protein